MSKRPLSPASYPPAFDAVQFIDRPSGPADLRIDVGAAIVGAGPGGLAAAIRLMQLLGDDAETLGRLGDVPVAVLEKGKAPGSHALSGAVVNPSALRDLFPDVPLEQIPGYGPVKGEAVYLLSKRRAHRLPTPPPFKNHGNWIFSLSRLARWLSERAEELGVVVLPETTADTLLVENGAIAGVRTMPMGLDRDGKEKPGAAPATEIVAQATVLAEGTQGHLRGVAFDHFDAHGPNPQVYALGVKEVWKVPKPLTRIIHTLGWPLSARKADKEFGGSFIYPAGDDHVIIGMVVGLDYADASLSVHDLLQELKTHPLVRDILAGGERVQWGAKTIPEGGYVALPRTLALPGGLLVGDSAGLVNVPKLKGVHYAMRSGMLAAEAIYAALKEGRDLREPEALQSYDAAVRAGQIGKDLKQVRNMRQAFQHDGFYVGGAKAGLMDLTKGRFPGGEVETHPDADTEMVLHQREYPKPDGALTFDKLSSVFASGNRTRDDQPNHIRLYDGRVPRAIAETWVNLCPAAVYEIVEGSAAADGSVKVQLAPSNCVQCGAITAKGGRLTPPEGGSGPEYTVM